MRKLIKVVVVLAIVLALLAGAGILLRNALLQKALPAVVERVTGFGFECRRIQIGLLEPVISVEGMKLLNPPDFPESDAFEVAEFRVEYEPGSLFSDPIVLRRVILDVPRVVLVQKPDGTTNLQRLMTETQQRTGAKGKKESTAEQERPATRPERRTRSTRGVLVREMRLHIGKLEARRYRTEGPPVIETVKIDRETTLYDVTDPAAVLAQVASQAVLSRAAEELTRALEKHGGKISLDEEKLEKLGKQLKDTLGSFFKKD